MCLRFQNKFSGLDWNTSEMVSTVRFSSLNPSHQRIWTGGLLEEVEQLKLISSPSTASKEPSSVTTAGSTIRKSDYRDRNTEKINVQSAHLPGKPFTRRDSRPLGHVLLIFLQSWNNDPDDQWNMSWGISSLINARLLSVLVCCQIYSRYATRFDETTFMILECHLTCEMSYDKSHLLLMRD